MGLWRAFLREMMSMFFCVVVLAAAPKVRFQLKASNCMVDCLDWRTMPYRACWLVFLKRAPCQLAIIMGIATGNAIMVTHMRMGNVRVTHRLMMSVRGMATNMVHVAMAATAINALALRNVGLADGNVASLICFQHR